MIGVDGDRDRKCYYWRIYYQNVNQQEVRIMKFNPEENWTRFSDRLCKKVNLTSDKALPLHYSSSGSNENIIVDDQEDYLICTLIMKQLNDSGDPQKGFKLYNKTNNQSRYPYDR